MMNIQRRSVEDMSPKEIRLNLYITQLIIISIGCLLAYILFPGKEEFSNLWKWEPFSILFIGGGIACGIVLVDYLAMQILPESWFDDGGINDRMFRGMSVMQLLVVTFLSDLLKNFYSGVFCKHILDLYLRALSLPFYISGILRSHFYSLLFVL